MAFDILVYASCACRTSALRQMILDEASDLKIEVNVTYCNKISEMSDYKDIETPAMIINGNLEINGRMPGGREIKRILREYIKKTR